jgi:hypothetical protein
MRGEGRGRGGGGRGVTLQSHLDRVALADDVRLGVDEVSDAEAPRLLFLRRIRVDADDARRADVLEGADDGETYAAEAKDSRRRPWLDLARVEDGSVARRHAAAEEADLLERRVLGDLGAVDLVDDGVLGEGGAAHEVQDLALRPALDDAEARRAVKHQAEALRVLRRRAAVRLLARAHAARTALGRVEGNAEVARGE